MCAWIVYKFVCKQVIELKAIPCLRSLKYHSKVMGLLLNCLCFSFILVREYKPSNVCWRRLPEFAFVQSIFVQRSSVAANCITPLIQLMLQTLVFSAWIISVVFPDPSCLWHPLLGNRRSQVSALVKAAGFCYSADFPPHFYKVSFARTMGIPSFAVVTIAGIRLELKGSAPNGQKTSRGNWTHVSAKDLFL